MCPAVAEGVLGNAWASAQDALGVPSALCRATLGQGRTGSPGYKRGGDPQTPQSLPPSREPCPPAVSHLLPSRLASQATKPGPERSLGAGQVEGRTKPRRGLGVNMCEPWVIQSCQGVGACEGQNVSCHWGPGGQRPQGTTASSLAGLLPERTTMRAKVATAATPCLAKLGFWSPWLLTSSRAAWQAPGWRLPDGA